MLEVAVHLRDFVKLVIGRQDRRHLGRKRLSSFAARADLEVDACERRALRGPRAGDDPRVHVPLLVHRTARRTPGLRRGSRSLPRR